MAWTRTKTALVAGVVVLLAAGTAYFTIKAVSAARAKTAVARLQGDWEGTLTANQTRLRLVLKIFQTNGACRASIDSVDQGVKDIPVARISAGRNSVHAELPAIHADYRATLNAAGTEMSGKWKQGGRSFRLKLAKTTKADRVAEAMPADDYAPRPGSDLQGAWEGTLKVGAAQLRLALRISEPTPGTFHAQMDSVDQGARNLPVTSLTYIKPAVHFEMTAINGMFEGTVNDQDDQIAGTWTQGGKKLPLTFHRVAANTQTTSAELDYGQGAPNEVMGHWKGTLEVGHTTLHIVFNIARRPDGSYAATLDSPDQGATGIPATTAEVGYPNVRLEWQAIGGGFTGKLENGTISGTWSQGKATFPLKLERTAAQ